jgi:aspartyl-tRNA(Asn)/glutamyl-tRNA(Gln) amidotransferase subunit B
MAYEAVIGLEVHVELLTKSKLFCSCPNRFTSEANSNTCEVCLGFPGALPLLNREAVQKALTAAVALNCEVAPHSYFDRKNYFYPDIPKGYQISQFYIPIGSIGFLKTEDDAGVLKQIRIGRVHMEEDAGKLIHAPAGQYSAIDYNRAGVPLIEIVTEPDLRSAGECRRFLEQLKSILQYSQVSDCKMEEGSLRCDANVSLRPKGSKVLGNKTELKNMNSFKAVEKAVAFEIARQTVILLRDESVISQTRRWEEGKQVTIAMRGKLAAHDYRCFADPELAPIELTAAEVDTARQRLPEMASARKARYIANYGLPPYDAGVLTQSKSLADYFEACLRLYNHPKVVSNWVMGEFTALINTAGLEPLEASFTPEHMAELLMMVEEEVISGKMAKEVMVKSFATEKAPRALVVEEGLLQISDQSELDHLADRVIEDNPDSVANYRKGKTNALSFLIGQVMRASKGKANPQIISQLLAEKLR